MARSMARKITSSPAAGGRAMSMCLMRQLPGCSHAREQLRERPNRLGMRPSLPLQPYRLPADGSGAFNVVRPVVADEENFAGRKAKLLLGGREEPLVGL